MDAAASIIVEAGAATAFAKVLVDLVKTSPVPTPGWLLPLLALVFGEGVSLLLLLAGTGTLNRQAFATTALVGIMAAGGSIGVTALQNKSNEASK